MSTYILAITGASGSLYGVRYLAELLRAGHTVHLCVSGEGKAILTHELGWPLPEDPAGVGDELVRRLGISRGELYSYGEDDLFAPIASGSVPVDGMAVVPCSMKTAAGIAHGYANTLIERAADVTLKEGRRLVLVPRETPLSEIHLANLLALARAGARIVAAMPGFYHRPRSMDDLVDFVVSRALDALGVPNTLCRRWEGGRPSRG